MSRECLAVWTGVHPIHSWNMLCRTLHNSAIMRTVGNDLKLRSTGRLCFSLGCDRVKGERGSWWLLKGIFLDSAFLPWLYCTISLWSMYGCSGVFQEQIKKVFSFGHSEQLHLLAIAGIGVHQRLCYWSNVFIFPVSAPKGYLFSHSNNDSVIIEL